MGKEAGKVSQTAQRGGKTLEMMQELKQKYAAVETENDQLRQQLAAEQAKRIAWELSTERAEATIAAMRSALEEARSYIYDNAPTGTVTNQFVHRIAKTMQTIDNALSNAAEAEHADRAKKLEEALRLVLRRYHKLDSDTAETIKAALGGTERES